MSPQARRHSVSAPPNRRRWSAGFVRPQCERLEERLALALFGVQSPFTFPAGMLNNNGCVAVSDLNKDGLADAVLTNFGTDVGGGAGTTITVLYGRASGGFDSLQRSTGGANPTFVRIGDINGDTWPDVVVSNANRENAGSVSVFRNDGTGNLVLVAMPFPTFGNNSSWVGLADLTGDGALDAVVGSPGRDVGGGNLVGNNVTLFQGNTDAQGKGNFTFSGSPITTLAPGLQFAPTSLAVADFDGDGRNDIAAAVPSAPPSSGRPQQDGAVYLFRGTGGAGFAAPTQFGSGGALPVDIKAANLNGDNRPDLVIANVGDPNANPEFSNDAIGVLLNNGSPGNAGFGVATRLTANSYGTFAVAVEDFNLDGRTDIAAVNYGGQTGLPAAFVSVYMGSGMGTFTPDTPGTYDTQTGVGGGQYLAVGDFDANGTPDLIVAHASNRVGLLINTTERPRVLSAQFGFSAAPQRLTFAFNQNVSGSLGLNDITVERLGVGMVTPAGLSFDTTTNTATVTFSGTMADGSYRATLNASGITNPGGTLMAANYVLDFFVLAGDINRDRAVNGTDFAILAGNFGKTGITYGGGDLNADGTVNGSDFAILAGNFGKSVPAVQVTVQAAAVSFAPAAAPYRESPQQTPLLKSAPSCRFKHRPRRPNS